MTPIVTTASFHPSAVLSYDATNNHITNYKFTDASRRTQARYDVVFLLSINGEFGPLLTDESGALDALTTFMQDGGGVFATGDHADLGAAAGSGRCESIDAARAGVSASSHLRIERNWGTSLPIGPTSNLNSRASPTSFRSGCTSTIARML